MTNCVFIKDISNDVFKNYLIKLLNNICIKELNTYIFSNSSYKKGLITNNIRQFIEECKPYYCMSKQHYLINANTYYKFITILRQVCKFLKIKYYKKIKYEKSSYQIIYYICMC